MKKTIWLNLDAKKVDVSYLTNRFAENYKFVAYAIPENDPSQVLEQAMQADAVISILEKWDKNTLAAVKGKVRFIQKYGMGLDNIDLDAAARNGIAVANVLRANSAAVAEVALLHILNVSRRFSTCVAGVKNKIWPSTITGTELDDKTVGLMGYGNIAKDLVRKLSGFRVNILVFDPFVTPTQQEEQVSFVSSKEELFAKSDIISLHIPYTEETQGCIDATLFSLMKHGAYLVNTCRGGVINEADLVAALQSGQLAAAGLDVLCEEPPSADNPLMEMNNVYITSHMGAESFEAGLRSQTIIANAIEKFFEGTLPDNVRNADLLKKYGGLLQ